MPRNLPTVRRTPAPALLATMQYKIGDEPIPGYRLLEFLGRGGFGEVWKADAPGGVPVALKIIPLGNQQGEKELRALEKIKSLRHNNLNQIQAFWLKDEEGNLVNRADALDADRDAPINQTMMVGRKRGSARLLVIAMTLADGSLAGELQGCKEAGLPGIPLEQLFHYLDGAAQAIDYLNSADQRHAAIQHCDIKPQNMLVVSGGCQVCDFGLARDLGDMRHTSIGVTYAYGAPECHEGKPSSTTDQYSLAISYIELRTGELPFPESATQMDVFTAKVKGKLDLSRLPPAEQEIIRKATSINPQKRFESARAMVKALRECALSAETARGAKPSDWIPGIFRSRSRGVDTATTPGSGVMPVAEQDTADNAHPTLIQPSPMSGTLVGSRTTHTDSAPPGAPSTPSTVTPSLPPAAPPRRPRRLLAAATVVFVGAALALGAWTLIPQPVPTQLPPAVEAACAKRQFADAIGLVARNEPPLSTRERNGVLAVVAGRWLDEVVKRLDAAQPDEYRPMLVECQQIADASPENKVVRERLGAIYDELSQAQGKLAAPLFETAEAEADKDPARAAEAYAKAHDLLHGYLAERQEMSQRHAEALLGAVCGYARAELWNQYAEHVDELKEVQFDSGDARNDLKQLLLAVKQQQAQSQKGAIACLESLDSKMLSRWQNAIGPQGQWQAEQLAAVLDWIEGFPSFESDASAQSVVDPFRPFDQRIAEAVRACRDQRLDDASRSLKACRRLASTLPEKQQFKLQEVERLQTLANANAKPAAIREALAATGEALDQDRVVWLAELAGVVSRLAQADDPNLLAAAQPVLKKIAGHVDGLPDDERASLREAYAELLEKQVATTFDVAASQEDFKKLLSLCQELAGLRDPPDPLYEFCRIESLIETSEGALSAGQLAEAKGTLTTLGRRTMEPKKELYGRYVRVRLHEAAKPTDLKQAVEGELDRLAGFAEQAATAVAGFGSEHRRRQLGLAYADAAGRCRARWDGFLDSMQRPFGDEVDRSNAATYAAAATALKVTSPRLARTLFLAAGFNPTPDQGAMEGALGQLALAEADQADRLPVLFVKATRLGDDSARAELAEEFARERRATQENGVAFFTSVIGPGIEGTAENRIKARLLVQQGRLFSQFRFATWPGVESRKHRAQSNLDAAFAAYNQALTLDPTGPPDWYAGRGLVNVARYESGGALRVESLREAEKDAAKAGDSVIGCELRGRANFWRSRRLTRPQEMPKRRQMLDNAEKDLAKAIDLLKNPPKSAGNASDEDKHGEILTYLSCLYIDRAACASPQEGPAIKRELLLAAEKSAIESDRLRSRDRYIALVALGNAQEALASLVDDAEYQDRWSKAIHSFRAAAAQNPEYAQAKVDQARVKYKWYKTDTSKAKLLQEAISDLQAVCAQPDPPAEAFYWAGWASLQDGNSSAGLASLRRAFEIAAANGRDGDAINWADAWADLWGARAKREGDQAAAEARAEFKSVAQIVPTWRHQRSIDRQSTEMCDTLIKRVPLWDARMDFERGNFQQALPTLSEALPADLSEATPDDVRLLTGRALCRLYDSELWKVPADRSAALADVKAALDAEQNDDDRAEALVALGNIRWQLRQDVAAQGDDLDWRRPFAEAVALVGPESRYRDKLSQWQERRLGYARIELKSLASIKKAVPYEGLYREAIDIVRSLPPGVARDKARGDLEALLADAPLAEDARATLRGMLNAQP